MTKRTQHTLILKADGTQEERPSRVSFEELRQIVGGHVTVTSCLHQERKCQLVCNEDGRLMKLPYNQRATEMFLLANPRSDDYMVGDVAVLVNWKV